MPRYQYTNEYYDNGKAELTCGLCSNTGLRYHFKLRNVDAQFDLWVGSECILKFAPKDYGNAEAHRKQMLKDDEEASVFQVFSTLHRLTGLDFWPSYARYGYLTPKQMLVLCRVFRDAEEDMPTPPKVCLRKQMHQAHYRSFTDTEKGLVFPHLSATQKARWMFGA